jgi:DNA repair protein RadC
MPSRNYCQVLPLITPSEALASAADEVLFAESDEGFADPVPRRQNPYDEEPGAPYGTSIQDLIEQETAGGRGKTRKPRKPRKWSTDLTALSLYAGHDGLLVRTALIRSPHLDPKEALPKMQDPAAVVRLLAHLAYADQEHLVVLAVNVAHRVQAIYEVGIGSSRGVAVQPRDIIKILLLAGSVGAIIAHNHPSGDPTPSDEDVEMTRSVKASFECLGYTLLDHVIVARNGHSSFHALGLL